MTVDQFLNDPYSIQKNGPAGFAFVRESSYSHESFSSHKERVQSFLKDAEKHREVLLRDYDVKPFNRVPLVDEEVEFNDSLSEAIALRASQRKFNMSSVSFAQLSFLLQMACGMRAKSRNLRMYPSGGGLTPCQVYVHTKRVTGLDRGVYFFNPRHKSLDLVQDPLDPATEREFNLQDENPEFSDPAFQLLISAKPHQTVAKYGEHGWRLIFLEAGHIAQNAWLVAQGLGLVGYPQSILDEKIGRTALRIDPQYEFLVYSLQLGHAQK